MSYLVLARKWRPQRFEDLIGQDHVARTLGNAIEQKRVAHAFLFTGVRGVGKTTSARILAKALNCMREPGTVSGEDPGPTATPCLKCDACRQIADGSDVDVREIDGASYNGVDEVRKLQDSLPYRPARDRYKIFIVDEVHMLSQSAWNAFLKTLEEPPPHVKFIFATTEVQKVPVTILSRVQRFDFRLIRARAIVDRLRYVLEQEGIEADDAALSIIAREAAGSMRDAMSLLDQVIAWKVGDLKGEDVARVLGVASRQVLLDLADALVSGDGARCLEQIEPLAEQGHDLIYVARDLLGLLRDLVVCKVSTKPLELVDLPAEEQSVLVELAGRYDTDDLIRLHQGFSADYDDVARSGQPRAALEMLLVRLARRPPLIPVDQLVRRLDALERRLRGGQPEARPIGRPGATPSRRPREPEAQKPRVRGEVKKNEDPPPYPAAATNTSTGSLERPEEASRPAGAATPAARIAARSPAPVDAPLRQVDAPEPEPAEPASPLPTSVFLLSRLREVVDELRPQRPELASFLEHGAVLDAHNGKLRLAFEPDSIFVGPLRAAESATLIEEAAARAFGEPTKVILEADYAPARGMETLAEERVRTREANLRKALSDAKGHPKVAEVIEIFGARLKDLRLNEEQQ